MNDIERRDKPMPRIGIVEGLEIYVFREEGGQHKHQHFHLRGRGVDVTLRIDNCEALKGDVPRNKRKGVREYWRRHQAEIQENYNLLNSDQPIYWIED